MLRTNFSRSGSHWKFRIMHYDEQVAMGLGPTKDICRAHASELKKELEAHYHVFPRKHKKIVKKKSCKKRATQDGKERMVQMSHDLSDIRYY